MAHITSSPQKGYGPAIQVVTAIFKDQPFFFGLPSSIWSSWSSDQI